MKYMKYFMKYEVECLLQGVIPEVLFLCMACFCVCLFLGDSLATWTAFLGFCDLSAYDLATVLDYLLVL